MTSWVYILREEEQHRVIKYVIHSADMVLSQPLQINDEAGVQRTGQYFYFVQSVIIIKLPVAPLCLGCSSKPKL